MSLDVAEQLRVNGGLIAMALGYLAAEWYAVRRAPAHGMPPAVAGRTALWALAAAIIAGRLVAFLRTPGVFLDNPVDLVVIRAGINFYAALAGAAAVVLVMAWRSGFRPPAALDLLALAALAGIATQRAGCVINNGCYGKVAPEPWGIRFPGLDQPRYPSEPLEAVLVLVLFAGLVMAAPRARPGTTFAAFLAGYGLTRFLVGFLRVSVTGFGPVSADQAGALLMAALGIIALTALMLPGWRQRAPV